MLGPKLTEVQLHSSAPSGQRMAGVGKRMVFIDQHQSQYPSMLFGFSHSIISPGCRLLGTARAPWSTRNTEASSLHRGTLHLITARALSASSRRFHYAWESELEVAFVAELTLAFMMRASRFRVCSLYPYRRKYLHAVLCGCTWNPIIPSSAGLTLASLSRLTASRMFCTVITSLPYPRRDTQIGGCGFLLPLLKLRIREPELESGVVLHCGYIYMLWVQSQIACGYKTLSGFDGLWHQAIALTPPVG